MNNKTLKLKKKLEKIFTNTFSYYSIITLDKLNYSIFTIKLVLDDAADTVIGNIFHEEIYTKSDKLIPKELIDISKILNSVEFSTSHSDYYDLYTAHRPNVDLVILDILKFYIIYQKYAMLSEEPVDIENITEKYKFNYIKKYE